MELGSRILVRNDGLVYHHYHLCATFKRTCHGPVSGLCVPEGKKDRNVNEIEIEMSGNLGDQGTTRFCPGSSGSQSRGCRVGSSVNRWLSKRSDDR